MIYSSHEINSGTAEKSQIPPAKPAACFYEPLKAVDFGTA
jgi:hypothetical protein